MKQLFVGIVVGIILGGFMPQGSHTEILETFKTKEIFRDKIITHEHKNVDGSVDIVREENIIDNKVSETVKFDTKKYFITVSRTGILLPTSYNISVAKKIIGPFSIVGGYNTKNEISLGIGMEF